MSARPPPRRRAGRGAGLAPVAHPGRRPTIAAGRVTVGGATADKPARLVRPATPSSCRPPARFVSRARGQARRRPRPLRARRRRPAGARRRRLDRRFTDCLLQRGAAEVVAVDVGHGQLHERLRRRPAGARARAHQRPRPRSRTRSAALSTSVTPTCRSSRCGWSPTRCWPSLRPGRRSGAAGEAAVRGRPPGGVQGPGDHPDPAGLARRARRGDVRHRRTEPPSWAPWCRRSPVPTATSSSWSRSCRRRRRHPDGSAVDALIDGARPRSPPRRPGAA